MVHVHVHVQCSIIIHNCLHVYICICTYCTCTYILIVITCNLILSLSENGCTTQEPQFEVDPRYGPLPPQSAPGPRGPYLLKYVREGEKGSQAENVKHPKEGQVKGDAEFYPDGQNSAAGPQPSYPRQLKPHPPQSLGHTIASHSVNYDTSSPSPVSSYGCSSHASSPGGYFQQQDTPPGHAHQDMLPVYGYQHPSPGSSSQSESADSAYSQSSHGFVPGYQGSVPGYQGSVPGYHGSVPGYQGSVPGYQGSVPGYQGSVPGYQGSVPGYQGSVPGYQGSVPGYSAINYPNLTTPSSLDFSSNSVSVVSHSGSSSSSVSSSANSRLTPYSPVSCGDVQLPNLLHFSFSELSTATHGFTTGLVGMGSFGSVFRAMVRGTGPYAIKKLHNVSLSHSLPPSLSLSLLFSLFLSLSPPFLSFSSSLMIIKSL